MHAHLYAPQRSGALTTPPNPGIARNITQHVSSRESSQA